MFIQHYFKKNKILESRKNYTDDYSYHPDYAVDMTLSGKFLIHREEEVFPVSFFDQYPPASLENELKTKISKKYNFDQENIILGCGCNGIFQNLLKIFFQKKGNLILPFYSFSQPEYAVNSFGSFVKRVYCTKDYHINFKEIENAIDGATRAIFIANPNNPTGIYEEPEKIINLVKKIYKLLRLSSQYRG